MGFYKRVSNGETGKSDAVFVFKLIGFFLLVGIIIGSLIR